MALESRRDGTNRAVARYAAGLFSGESSDESFFRRFVSQEGLPSAQVSRQSESDSFVLGATQRPVPLANQRPRFAVSGGRYGEQVGSGWLSGLAGQDFGCRSMIPLGNSGFLPLFLVRQAIMETVGIGTSFTVPLFHLCHLFASDPTANVEFNGRQPAAKHAKPRRTSASFFFFFSLPLVAFVAFPSHSSTTSRVRHFESDISHRAQHAAMQNAASHNGISPFQDTTRLLQHHLHPTRNKS